MIQRDLFGNDVEVVSVPKSGRRYKTMQELHGTIEGVRCGKCKHCVGYKWNKKIYYKCEIWIVSSSEATDIRLKNTACKKFVIK